MKVPEFSWNVYIAYVYAKKKMNNKNFNIIILIIYVNNMFILIYNEFDINKCNAQLKSKLKMKVRHEFKIIFEMYIHSYTEENTFFCIVDEFIMINFKED